MTLKLNPGDMLKIIRKGGKEHHTRIREDAVAVILTEHDYDRWQGFKELLRLSKPLGTGTKNHE